MKCLRLNFLYFFLIINFVLNDTTQIIHCYTNLECLDTGCCHDNKCTKASKCERINKITYALVGCAGFIFIGLTFLVFFFKIKKTKESVLALKKIDDQFYSKRKNSNYEMFKSLKSRQGNINK